MFHLDMRSLVARMVHHLGVQTDDGFGVRGCRLSTA
jgi:hypothetical protein